MADAILECGGADLGIVSDALPFRQAWPWTKTAGNEPQGELHVGQPLWFWRHGANAAKKPTNAYT